MHVLINRTAAAPGTAGHVHLVETAAALNRIGADARFTVLLTRRQAAMAEQLPSKFNVELVALPDGGTARSLRLQRIVPALVKRTGADVLFNPGNFFVWHPGCAQVCFIENANVFSHPSIEWRASERRRNFLLRQVTRLALRYADHVVFPSHDSAAGFAAVGRIRPPVSVAHYGWRAHTPAAGSLAEVIQGRYILCVSSVLPHKNLVRLVRAFRRLADRHGYRGRLVIIGYAGASTCRAAVDKTVAEEGLEDRVAVLPPASPRELAAGYAAADAVVNPSLEETFGIPAIEAMGYGRPQALADTSRSGRGRFFNPFRELCGDAAEYFDPFDVDDMAAAMAVTLDARRMAPRVDVARRRAGLFRWDMTASRLWQVFQDLTKGDARQANVPLV